MAISDAASKAGQGVPIARGSTFKYEPLNSDDLRLLHIQHDRHNEGLAFSLAHYPRSEAPSYVAISYAWGSELAEHAVIVDGHTILVRPNLWQALFHISTAKEAKKEWKYLWCDAICLDQENIVEKSEQVGQMYLVYRNAALVIAWVGPYPKAESTGQHAESYKRSRQEAIIPEDVVSEEFLQQPYFSRVWVVPETMSARRTMFMLGRRRVNNVDLTLKPPPEPKSREARIFVLASPSIRSWDRFEKLFLPKDVNQRLVRLAFYLNVTRYCLCSDPRDRVFALLSILRIVERQILLTFFPDYSLSWNRVCLITMGFLMQDPFEGQQAFTKGRNPISFSEACDSLNIESAEFREELRAKSLTTQTIKDLQRAKFQGPHGMRQRFRENFSEGASETDWTRERTAALKVIASSPISGESDAQFADIKLKSWYVDTSCKSLGQDGIPPVK